jgi:hypothetical protein
MKSLKHQMSLANEQLLSALDAKAGEAKGNFSAGIAHNVKTITDNFLTT